ncbi:MAG: glycosyltransferase [Acetatifactor sp.]|nr:glycosyltransferase [Acetatifactor sp.]
MYPIISIITVCYNSENTISKTIASVLAQDLSEAEYLIIDGASTDRTISIINEYKDLFGDKLSIVSEKDNGWYDAMNKGISNSHGKFIVFLNSDDYFDKNIITEVVKFAKVNNLTDDSIIYGDSTNVYRNSKGEIFHRFTQAPEALKRCKDLRDGMCGIRHQAMFTGRRVFEKVGMLNLKYRLHADWDFLVKCLDCDIKMMHIRSNVVYYSMYGASTKPNYLERHQLRKDNHLYRMVDWYYVKDRWGLKVILKRILGENRWNDLLFRIHVMKKKTWYK